MNRLLSALAVLLGLAPLAHGQHPYLFLEGKKANEGFGREFTALGDVDDDGIADLAVVASLGKSPYVYEIRVLSGATGLELYEIDDPPLYDVVYPVLSAMGDLDGDGAGDFHVHAPQVIDRIYSGRDGTRLFDVPNESGGAMTDLVRSVGDLDGDGVPDAVVVDGNYGDDHHLTARSGIDWHELYRLELWANEPYVHLGVWTLGDLDGDGVPEFAYGSQFSTVKVISGGPGSVLLSVPGVVNSNSDVGTTADRDGDGVREILTHLVYPDRILVSSGADGSALEEIAVPDHFRLLGDVDADGVEDWATGKFADEEYRGLLRVHSGVDGSLLLTHNGHHKNVTLGALDLAGADLDGDGVNEVVAGAPAFMNSSFPGYIYALRVGPPIGSSYCSPAVPNSTGLPAELVVRGSVELGRNMLYGAARQLPLHEPGCLLAATASDHVPMAGGGEGTLCVGGEGTRVTSSVLSSGADGFLGAGIDFTTLRLALAPGDRLHLQIWYLDSLAGPTSNLSDAVRLILE